MPKTKKKVTKKTKRVKKSTATIARAKRVKKTTVAPVTETIGTSVPTTTEDDTCDCELCTRL